MIFFDILPIVAAIFAALCSARKIKTIRRRSDMIIAIMSVVSALLLIVAQTSWWVSFAVLDDLLGTWFANVIWGVFDTLVMVIIIMNSRIRS